MDAIQLLKDDHQTVDGLFARYEAAGEGAYKTKGQIVDRIIKELSVHAAIEEEIFYPATREARGETEQMLQEAYQEHAQVKQTLSRLEGMDPEDASFDQMVIGLIEDVRHHVQEEEGEMLPMVQQALPTERLEDLGAEMKEAKKSAPRSPSQAA